MIIQYCDYFKMNIIRYMPLMDWEIESKNNIRGLVSTYEVESSSTIILDGIFAEKYSIACDQKPTKETLVSLSTQIMNHPKNKKIIENLKKMTEKEKITETILVFYQDLILLLGDKKILSIHYSYTKKIHNVQYINIDALKIEDFCLKFIYIRKNELIFRFSASKVSYLYQVLSIFYGGKKFENFLGEPFF